ncbi:TonB-dependent receptor [Cupriavidus agavae]|uniref:Iron complex outermembrane receptor protein n=1 Tax=Cupriavidus agavae TaxID=1001822 RepID=A0A4Q7S1P4_9BURK|nr:TonB-dependent receptor [Cupriavidus agavae]RZT39240.1 iron complex outermembrane receptor protein [Cupriavidus agavae]
MGPVQARKRQAIPVFRRKLLASLVGRVALGAIVAAPLGALPLAAHAQAARSYSIPAGSLEDTLSRFGRDAGIMLSFKPEITAGKRSAGLDGTYTARGGLDTLLANTGLEVTRQPNGSYLINGPVSSGTAEGGAMLPAVTVTAAGDSLPPAYAGGQVARGGGLGVLGTANVLDQPFSTTNYTAEFLDNTQAKTLADVVINDSSVRVLTSRGGFGEDFQIRGYTVSSGDVGVNGLYGMASSSRLPAAIMERVEVLKGPGTLMYGIGPNGSIGGAINVVTKRAENEPLTRLTTTYESKSLFGVQADVGRRFGENKEWGVRVNGVFKGGDTTIDDGRQKLGVGALALDYRGKKLRWTLDTYTQHEGTDNFRPQVGFLAGVTSMPSAPSAHRNFYPGTELWLHDTAVMSRLEYDLSPNLTVYAAGGYREGSAYQTFPLGFANAQGAFTPSNSYYDSYSKTWTADVGARANFNTFGIGHLVTASFTRLEQETGSAYTPSTAAGLPSSIYNPTPLVPVVGTRLDSARQSESAQTSFTLTDTLSMLDDRLLLTGGFRHQRVVLDNYSTATGAQTGAYDQSAVSPVAGIVVKPLQNVSVYGNFTSGLSRGGVAPVGTANAGQVFAPYKSNQYEAGVKADWGKVMTQVSVFQLERPGAVTDPATNTYSFDGEQRNRGVELSAYGEVARGLRMMASATFYDAKLKKTAGGVNDGKDANGVPDYAFNLGADWDMPWVPGLSLNGRIIHTSSVYFNAANTLSMPSWTRYDIGARYRTKVMGKSVVFRANIENLFGSNYWLVSGTYATVAAPRTVLLSAQFDF